MRSILQLTLNDWRSYDLRAVVIIVVVPSFFLNQNLQC